MNEEQERIEDEPCTFRLRPSPDGQGAQDLGDSNDFERAQQISGSAERA
jgi:hypothetical protein